MKKKNIAFILFAVAGLNLIMIPILPLIFTPLYETMGMPAPLPSLVPTIINLTTLIPIVILVVVGIIIYIKYRDE